MEPRPLRGALAPPAGRRCAPRRGGGRGAPRRAVSLHGLSRGARRGRDWGGGCPQPALQGAVGGMRRDGPQPWGWQVWPAWQQCEAGSQRGKGPCPCSQPPKFSGRNASSATVPAGSDAPSGLGQATAPVRGLAVSYSLFTIPPAGVKQSFGKGSGLGCRWGHAESFLGLLPRNPARGHRAQGLAQPWGSLLLLWMWGCPRGGRLRCREQRGDGTVAPRLVFCSSRSPLGLKSTLSNKDIPQCCETRQQHKG